MSEDGKKIDARLTTLAQDILDHPHFEFLFRKNFDEHFERWLKTRLKYILGLFALLVGLGITEYLNLGSAQRRIEVTLTSDIARLNNDITNKESEISNLDRMTGDLKEQLKTINQDGMEAKRQNEFADKVQEMSVKFTDFAEKRMDEVAFNLKESQTDLDQARDASKLIESKVTDAEGRVDSKVASAEEKVAALSEEVNQGWKNLRRVKAVVSEVVALKKNTETAIEMPDLEPPYTNKFILTFMGSDIAGVMQVKILVLSNNVILNPNREQREFPLDLGKMEQKSPGGFGGPDFEPDEIIPKKIKIVGTPFAFSPVYYYRNKLPFGPDFCFLKVYYVLAPDIQ